MVTIIARFGKLKIVQISKANFAIGHTICGSWNDSKADHKKNHGPNSYESISSPHTQVQYWREDNNHFCNCCGIM